MKLAAAVLLAALLLVGWIVQPATETPEEQARTLRLLRLHQEAAWVR